MEAYTRSSWLRWAKLKSWHAVKETVDRDGEPLFMLTYCGRKVVGFEVDKLPAGKSCESCLRIVARFMDAS